jgi:hypothetical protein
VSGEGSLKYKNDPDRTSGDQMSQETFSRREVERAFRKFNDLVTDVMGAVFQTWEDCFTHLITHCEQNPVMRVITEPLRENKNVDASKWYAECMGSVQGMVGSARYTLPTDDDDRTALLYQFFLKVEHDPIDITNFCLLVYGTSKFQEMVRVFNAELVQKFAREVSYRLNEIMQDIGNATEVRRDAMLVFHIHDHSRHDHSMSFHGPVMGANIAGPGSSITGSSATYNNNADVSEALKTLKPLISEVAAEQRQAVEGALATMIRAAESNIPVARVAEVQPAVAQVAAASPTLKKRLADIGGKLGLSLAGSAIFQAIKMVLGIH